ncbi:MAG TPA: response regulator transcription factor [bacterium]|nr:response regulator transcription factor [bacterium]
MNEIQPSAKTRVLVVDDHPIVREGLALLFRQKMDLEICGEAEDAEQTLAAIAARPPDIAIIDITLKNSNGLDLIRLLRDRHPSLPVLVLSVHDESIYAERALRAGARGYIMKEELTEKVVEAIHCVLNGKIYLSPRMSEKLLTHFVGGQTPVRQSPVERLSDRELAVYQMIGQGLGTRDIAERMHISPKTVQSYRSRIKDKLQLGNSSDLLQHAVLWTHSQQEPPSS